MHTLYNFTKKLYIKSVEAHIRLLTLDYTKHQATEAVYEDLFDVFHKVGEQSEAIGEPINEDTECKAIIQDLIDDETKLASIIEKQVKDGLDLGSDNLLRSLYEGGQKRLAKLKSLIAEGEEETEDTEEPMKEMAKIKVPK